MSCGRCLIWATRISSVLTAYCIFVGGGLYLDNILIISSTENGAALFKDMLSQMLPGFGLYSVATAKQARDALKGQSFFLCLINAPLSDEFGDLLAFEIAGSSISQVLLIVKKQLYDDILPRAEKNGVLLISKPIVKNVLFASVAASKACYNRLRRMSGVNSDLVQKIDDIKLIDRAKCVLIEVLKMTEQGAHRYIEKQAMDMRKSKRDIAESIIKTYEL